MSTTTRPARPASPPPPAAGPRPASPPPRAAPRRDLWLTQLLAALALLAGATAIDAILVGSQWWERPVIAVAVVLAVGIALRRTRLPGWVTSVIQLGVLALLVAQLFDVSTTAQVSEVLRQATAHIQVSGSPAGVVPAIEFVLTAVMGLLAVVVDALAVRAPALVAVPLLGVFATGSTFAVEALPWVTMVLPGVAYVLLLASAPLRARRLASAASVTRADRGAIVAIGVVAVVASFLVTTTADSIDTQGRLERTEVIGGPGTSPFTGLVGDLLRGEPQDLLTYRSDLTPRYMGAVALTEWTNGEGWSLAREPEVDRTDGLGDSPDGGPGAGAGVTIDSLGYDGRFLPVLEGTTEVVAASEPWFLDEALSTWHRDEPVDPGSYLLLVEPEIPTVQALEADTVTAGGADTEVGDLPAEVRDLTQQVTAEAPTPFAKALALQRWFTDSGNGFVYSLSVPEGTSGDALVDFLQLRRGYCEQYASAMAVMLRSIDIPARVVVGYGSGTMGGDGITTITSHNAHAWVEVRFDGAGWVRFDPTPGGGGQGGTPAPSIAGLEAPASPSEGATQTVEPDPTPTGADGSPTTPAEPTAAPSPSEAPTTDPGTGTGGTSGPTLGGDPPDPWEHVGRGELALALLLALVTGPQAFRFWRARRRMRVVGGGGTDAAEAAWTEIEDLALDHGLVLAPTRTVRENAVVVGREAHLHIRARERVAALVRETESERYAAESSAEVAGSAEASERGALLTRAVGDVALGLEHHRSPGPWRWWFPPSLRRRP